MADEQALFTQDPNTEEYVPYEPPAPPAFRETLPEDIRDNEHIKSFENPDDLAKSYIDLASQRPVVPEKPDEYSLEVDGYDIDSDRLTGWKAAFHESGLTQDQAKALFDRYIGEERDTIAALNEDVKRNREENETALKKDWGDKFEQNTEKARLVWNLILGKMGDHGKSLAEFMETTKLGDEAHFLRLMHFLSTFIDEDTLTRGSPKPAKTELGRTESGNIVYDDYPEMRQK